MTLRIVRFRTGFSSAVVAVASLAALPSPGSASGRPIPDSPIAPAVSFSRIEPILKASCVSCHGPDQAMGGLRLDSRDSLLRGGVSGKAIVPGRAKDSILLQRILGEGGKPRMPIGFAPLSDEQTELLRRWIDGGAKADGASPPGAVHWAYRRPVRPSVPAVRNRAWVRNPIDAFVLSRIEKEGLAPSPEASRETLLRRVTLDLIGLPPTPNEIDAFLADRRPDAYERVVDRLLASPHHGERWARPWLDLARYADTNGYEKDERRSIWMFRDWVIDSINRDLPYDRFTIEQIAGDMLPHPTIAQRIATGFHRNTMYNAEGGVDREEARWITLVDRVGTTASAWLGSTLACAQCHDHKYDPFSQKDFYQFLAFFENAEEPDLERPTPAQAAARASRQAEIDRLSGILKSLSNAGEGHSAPESAKAGDPAAPPNGNDSAVSPGGVDRKVSSHTASDAAFLRDRIAKLEKERAAITVPTTLVFREKPDSRPPATFLRVKGSFLRKGEEVEAGTPAILGLLPSHEPRNRLGLARWLADERNPLTARVAVNRAWEGLFGRGIVETSEDFGTMGSPPSHPELLDWLATEFMHRGWSRKALLRLLVTSAAYRQSSRVTPRLAERDPNNRLLARGPRSRLDAETIRDVALAASGLLDRRIGGPSVFPPQPEGIWNIPYNGDRWVTSEGKDRYRRGIYTFLRRTSPYPMLLTFDGTSREFCTVRRTATNTPLQALNLLNDEALFEAARALAKRIDAEAGPSPAAAIARGFRLCAGRRASAAEADRLLRLHRSELQHFTADAAAAEKVAPAGVPARIRPRLAALAIVANVLLNLDETVTKE